MLLKWHILHERKKLLLPSHAQIRFPITDLCTFRTLRFTEIWIFVSSTVHTRLTETENLCFFARILWITVVLENPVVYHVFRVYPDDNDSTSSRPTLSWKILEVLRQLFSLGFRSQFSRRSVLFLDQPILRAMSSGTFCFVKKRDDGHHRNINRVHDVLLWKSPVLLYGD